MATANINTIFENAKTEIAMDQREAEKPYVEPAYVTWYSPRYFSKPLEEAVEAFDVLTGRAYLPHNMLLTEMSGNLCWGPVGGRWRQPFTEQETTEYLEYYRRSAFWFRAAPEHVAVMRMIKATQSWKGMNSPRTLISLQDVVEAFPSPATLEKRLWAVRERAVAIMSSYSKNVVPSWAAIIRALLKNKQVGKAAIMAVANHLRDDVDGKLAWEGHTYRQAREYLVSIRSSEYVFDDTDGVVLQRSILPVYQRLGVVVFETVTEGRHGFRKQGYLVLRNGESYHEDCVEYGIEWAISRALGAWKQRREVEKQNADLVGYLKGNLTGYCPIFYRQDSYQVGNCSSGTEAFLRENGKSHSAFVTAEFMLKNLEHGLAMNVVRGRMRPYLQDIQKAA